MKLFKNYRYHLLNLVGWLFYVVCTLSLDKLTYRLSVVKIFNAKQYNALFYILTEGVLCALLGFVLSYVILYFVETKLVIGKLDQRKWFGLFLVFGFVQLCYHLILWPMLDIPCLYYYGESNELHLNFLMNIYFRSFGTHFKRRVCNEFP